MLCINPNCSNTVPEGWEGGYCVACCNAIEDAENERRHQFEMAEHERIKHLPPSNEPDPHEEYGFDYPWEMNQ